MCRMWLWRWDVWNFLFDLKVVSNFTHINKLRGKVWQIHGSLPHVTNTIINKRHEQKLNMMITFGSTRNCPFFVECLKFFLLSLFPSMHSIWTLRFSQLTIFIFFHMYKPPWNNQYQVLGFHFLWPPFLLWTYIHSFG